MSLANRHRMAIVKSGKRLVPRGAVEQLPLGSAAARCLLPSAGGVSALGAACEPGWACAILCLLAHASSCVGLRGSGERASSAAHVEPGEVGDPRAKAYSAQSAAGPYQK